MRILGILWKFWSTINHRIQAVKYEEKYTETMKADPGSQKNR